MAALLSALLSQGVSADPEYRQRHEPGAARQAEIPLSTVVQHLESGSGSRVIGASRSVSRDGLPVYRIKLLSEQGVLRQIQVDPRTGQQK